MKRTLCLFLALILAVGICFSAPVTITASAAFTLESGTEHTVGAVYIDSTTGVKFKITDIETKQVEVCGYSNLQHYLVIPATVNISENGGGTLAYSVTAIGASAFANCNSLYSVVIPEGVITIGEDAFYFCKYLRSVTIPESVTSIGARAFSVIGSIANVNVPCKWQEKPLYKFSSEYDQITVTIADHAYKDGVCEACGYECPGHTYELAICTNCSYVCHHETVTNGVCEVCGGTYCGKTESDTVFYFYNESTKTLTISGEGEMADFTDTTTVPWYSYRSEIATIVINKGVTSIGKISFYYCTALTSVTIPESVTTIGNGALHDCTSLTTIKIPDSVTTIGESAFSDCTSLTSVTIPYSVTSIDAWAFIRCTSLTSVTIPYSVTTIGVSAFNGCTALTTVNAPCSWNEKPLYTFDEGVKINIERHTIENNTCTVCEGSKCGATESDTVAWVYDEGTLYINGSGAMADNISASVPWKNYKSEITTVIIESGVTTIGNYAFNNCTSLPSVTIPESVTTIGESAFEDCTSLTTIEIPDSVTTIGKRAFSGCTALTSVTIPSSVTSIANLAFYNCTKLTTVNVPCNWDGSIYKFAESKLKIAEHNTTKSATCISKAECSVCGEYGDFAPHTYENGKGKCTVANCDNACAHEIITDGDCVACGGKHCGNTENDKVVWFYDASDDGNDETLPILTITGKGAMADYEGDNKPWNSFKSQITNVIINNGVTTIGNYAFGECSNLKSATIPETVTTIGKYAFYGCTKLTSVTIPDSVITISANAFSGCSELESVTIGNKVTSIGEKAFYGCSALTNVTFGENVTSLGNYAFANCTSLTTVTLPEKITSVSEECFKGCTSLTSVTIPDGVTSIGAAAFSNCTNLATVTIPEGVTTIGNNAFSNCAKLQTVTIPDSVTSIGEKVFGGSTNVLLFVDENNSYLQNYATANNINYVFDGSGELGKLTFTINDDGESYSVTGCDTSISGALEIPDKFNGKPVTEIGYSAFANCESLTSVVIPDSVGSLGEMAFYVCNSLETVTLSSNITVIPDEAFAYCHSLKTLPITEKITSIGEYAFYGSGKHSKVSLSGVTIGPEAFRACGITELTLVSCNLEDASVFIGNDIEKLTLSETNIPDEMFDGDSYIKTLVAEDSVLGSRSFAGCTELESVTVFGGEIKSDAFLACSSLETVTIDNIGSVGGYAFNDCSALKTVEVNATEISEYAFSMCTSLENVKLGDNVEIIGDAVFETCTSLAEIKLPETVTKIGKGVFNGCNLLTELVIPKSVTEISDGAFWGCFNLKYIFFEGKEDSQKNLGDALDTGAKIHYGSSTHTFNENYTVDTEPTCTEKGSESQHCKYCDLTQNSKGIKENGHTPIKVGTQDVHTKCDVCKEVLSATHNPTSKVTTAPTCTKEGVETFTCECGYTYTKPVAKLGHDKVSHSAKSATCEAIGWYAYDTCSRCDYTTYKEIAKLGHDIVIDKAVEATCTKTGLTEGSHCSRCDDKTVKQNVIPTKAHTEVTVTGKAATCTQAGLTDGKKCSVCGTVTVSQQVIAELGHDYAKDFTTDKEPTYTEAGSKSKHCSRCDAKTEVTVIAKKVLATPEVTFKATEKGMQVNWNKIDGAESYIVYKKTYNAKTKKWSGWSRIKTGVTATTYTDATVKLGTYYKYTVRAVNGDVLSKFVTLTGLKYNVTPTVKVANASNGVKVSWSTAANATGYTVYRSQYNTKTKKWSNWKNMGTAKANKTSWVDKKVTSGVSYKYTVRAVNGKILSSYKASASLMFLSQPTVKFANASTGVKVAWSKVKGATGYTVYRSELVDGKWTKWSNRGTAKANKSSWVDKKVESGVTYKYTVRAINGKVKSSFIDTKGLLYLTQPTVTVKAVSNGINVAWSQCEGATGYTVYRSEYNTKTKKWSKWSNRGTAKAEKSNWTDKKATKGVTYKYTVRAVNADTGAKSTYVASNAVKR